MLGEVLVLTLWSLNISLNRSPVQTRGFKLELKEKAIFCFVQRRSDPCFYVLVRLQRIRRKVDVVVNSDPVNFSEPIKS